MNTFIQESQSAKIDTRFLNTLETPNMVDSLDDLLEAYLTHILHMERVRQVEILLLNSQNTLMPVAKAKWHGVPHKREAKVYSECWVLDYPIKYTSKRIRRARIRPVFSIPLMDSGAIMGFLNIELEKLHLIEKSHLNKFYLIGLQVAASIKEIRLKSEIKEIKEELQLQVSNNNEIRQQATSLSKELYAISAISAKINQSMDFDKTLHRCLTTIRKVFKASSILIYTRSDANRKIELAAIECEDEPANEALNGQCLKSIEKNHLKEVLQSGKPLVKERLGQLIPTPEGKETKLPFASLIGIPLNSRETTIGVMMLLYESPGPLNHSGLRLLSGMANIMGMAIENMALYRQSIQKKNEIDFLFRSIVKFNKTLDLKATLTSVAEKGVEYCGVSSRVYLFSQIKAQVIHSHYEKQKRGYAITSALQKKMTPGKLKRVYLELSGFISEESVLIRSIGHCRKIARAAKPDFRELNIYSLVAVPLKVRQKKLGMLLLVRGREATSFGQHELRFAEALASAASLAIENARAYTASLEMSDFLEKKISEKTSQIRQIQAHQRVRVENRKDLIFQVNRHNRFVFANKAMELLSGLPREILCHKDFSADRVVAAEERSYIRSLFRKILTKEISLVKDVEYHHISHKGDGHVISLTIYPEYDSHGRVVGVEGVGRDITEKKRLEAELKKAKELALLGEFSSAVAHQMRNPLGNILMGTKRLESALGLDAGKWGVAKEKNGAATAKQADQTQMTEIFKNLSQGVHNLNQVVTELLEYTKTLKLSRSVQRMDIIMRETVQTFASLLDQHNINVDEHFQDELPSIPVDAVLMGQVFQNVIYNAIQAMPTGGELGLFVGMSDSNPHQMLLFIRDSGMGIDPAEIDSVFRPFYTTKTLGTGLGLSVSHRIVEAHGGVIQVCRNPCPHLPANGNPQTDDHIRKTERGTTVHIMLPAAAGSDNTTMRLN
jgi:PAS domain S-box-containing protein